MSKAIEIHICQCSSICEKSHFCIFTTALVKVPFRKILFISHPRKALSAGNSLFGEQQIVCLTNLAPIKSRENSS